MRDRAGEDELQLPKPVVVGVAEVDVGVDACGRRRGPQCAQIAGSLRRRSRAKTVAGEWWVRSAAPAVICSTNFAPTGKVVASRGRTNSWMKSEFRMSAISSSVHPF